MMSRRRHPTRLATLLLVTAAAVVGCDPGWFLFARNETDEVFLLRIASPGSTEVFRLPPRFDGHVDSELAEFDARIELLNEDCEERDAAVAPTSGDVLVVVMADHSIRIEPTSHDTSEAPSAEELRGICGSDKAPSP